jgi:hypothetical protein
LGLCGKIFFRHQDAKAERNTKDSLGAASCLWAFVARSFFATKTPRQKETRRTLLVPLPVFGPLWQDLFSPPRR